MKQGTRVIVTCAGGTKRENVVWEDCGDVVMVCGAEQFARRKDGYPTPMPIGFKRSDVEEVGASAGKEICAK